MGFAVMALRTSFSVDGSSKMIGVCMPMKSVDRWLLDGENIKKQLEAKGYNVMLEYAENSNDKQIAQIQDMINKKCKALIIAAFDCYNLNSILEKAAKDKIIIVAYDRLLMNTKYVDYYCTFDNFEVGQEQGEYIVNTFKLNENGSPIYMELFSGAIDDSCSPENYNGQMSVIRTYIDDGKILVKSGQTSLESTAIPDWATDEARARMEELLSKYYSDGTELDVVLSTNDSMALGIIEALKKAGYGDAGKPFPVITGMDCDKDNIIAIKNGEQSMSLFIDTRALSTRAVELVDDVMAGKQPVINDTTRYFNGVKIVPTSICKSIYVDKNNYLEVLVRSGYYREDDFK